MIGMGKMGLSHASILSTMPDVEIVGCVDPSPAAMRLARSVGVRAPFFSTVADALGRKPDAAFLCLPSHLNLRVVRECVEGAAHVFVEKPLASDLATAKEMLALERDRPRLRFGVGFMGAHVATFAKARDQIAAGTIGSVTRAVARAEHSLVFDRHGQWLFKRAQAGGGAAMAIGSHAILQVDRLLGHVAAVETATCEFTTGNEVEDSGDARLILDTGEHVDLFFDWSAEDRPQMAISLEVFGTQGTLRVSETWLEIESDRGSAVTHISELPDPARFYLGGDGYCVEDQRFVESCLGRAAPIVTWSDAYHVQEVIHAIYASAERHARVEVGG